jgi:23S rRNA (adenine1618-N6)-methyltransferase
MIDESVSLKTRCQWYTSMLGKLSSVPLLVETLRAVGVENWCVKEFIQGEKTRRWAIAWSWVPLKPAQVSRENPQSTFKPVLYSISTTQVCGSRHPWPP